MSAILDYLIEPLLILLLFIAFILLFIVGIVFWYVAFPILIIVTTARTFNRTQEKYKYNLKFWIESLNILDFLLIITYILSLGLYFITNDARQLCLYLNIGTFVGFVFNQSTVKQDYFVSKSKFALSYVDFSESKRFIKNKIYDIMKYDLHPGDIELLSDLKTNPITVHSYDEDEFKNSASRLVHHQFAIKNIINENDYSISINNKLLPYLKGDTNESSNIFS